MQCFLSFKINLDFILLSLYILSLYFKYCFYFFIVSIQKYNCTFISILYSVTLFNLIISSNSFCRSLGIFCAVNNVIHKKDNFISYFQLLFSLIFGLISLAKTMMIVFNESCGSRYSVLIPAVRSIFLAQLSKTQMWFINT